MARPIFDESTARSFDTSRRTVGAILSTIQTHLQKVFIVFTIGFLGIFYALRAFVWDWLRAITESKMSAQVAGQHEIIVTTPFEVILLQAKIGIIGGVLIAVPPLVYLSRHELRAQGYWPRTSISYWKFVGISLVSILLFLGGVAYAYGFFFPLILGFLAEFSYNVGIDPTWSIVMWAEFLVLLTLSFGLAAQLPLVMIVLAYTEIVPYETFRDKWRHAVLGMFVFGAIFSPPDPISQLMWALPLTVLYAVSLGITRFIVALKRGGQPNVAETFRKNLSRLLGIPLLLAAGAYAVLATSLGENIEKTLLTFRTIVLPETLPVHGSSEIFREVAPEFGIPVLLFLISFLILAIYLVIVSVEDIPLQTGRMGDPTALDLTTLDAAGIRAAPDASFETLSEVAVLSIARKAIDSEDYETAQSVLDRFDAIDRDNANESSRSNDVETATADTDQSNTEDIGGILTGSASGMFASFSEEKDEDDIGGYIYDIKYIVDSLRSRLLWIFLVFGVVLMGVFTFFYMGGVRIITQDFVSRMPSAVVSIDDIRIIDLHPVETLMFIIKVSTLAGALAVLPMVLYYAWPAMKDRGLTDGQQSVVYEWTLAIALALGIGTLLGYYYIAPGLIGLLVYDAVQGGMRISYRISSFSWLIIYTTVGVGLLACVPVTMWMLFRGKIASYNTMRHRWREVTIAVLVIVGIITPTGTLTMILVAVPIMLAYGIGLAGLWVVTVGGRLDFGNRISH
ncbi:Sec-independent protein translocase protein TatC [Halalkalicoccus paucihalophilus]|uniref:Sec-independent protein translocase protein TatC n=1 Tax=Halalkalicoccus paucihalophilus TaxID=1008153 RepID=A0A151AAA9_9EURY|nr:twin-arginine translocase subunit TatC [Halalkalicoccus paucihalophilus]KYH24621.1 Sec-independent protein translocase protein TatC [Halalkalicoccus paucihalophilus]